MLREEQGRRRWPMARLDERLQSAAAYHGFESLMGTMIDDA
jgi:hypothetical protein